MKEVVLYEGKIYARNGEVTISRLIPEKYTYDETSRYTVYKRKIWHDDKSLGPTEILVPERALGEPYIEWFSDREGRATGSIHIHEDSMWMADTILKRAKNTVLYECREHYGRW